MKSGFSAGAFLAGLVVGTVALSLIGSIVRPTHLVDGFKRFHIGFNNREFNATGRELKAIADSIDRDKIVVVVGGTSVLQGATQPGDRVWTNYLQAELGSTFHVLNVAQRSGSANDTGNLVAEMMLRDNRRLIYVCDAMTYGFTRILEQARYRQIVFDAWRRNYLFDWKPRDDLMRKTLWSGAPEVRAAAWGSLLDRVLNFRDLWNYVTFEIAGTIWNPLDQTNSFMPLRKASDPEIDIPPRPAGAGTEIKVADADLTIIKGIAAPVSDAHWQQVDKGIHREFPPAIRGVTLVIVDLNNPAYLAHLTAQEQERYSEIAAAMRDHLSAGKFLKAIIPETGFLPDDFSDRVHLSVQGGRKLALILAPEIRDISRQLGYSE